MIARENHYTKSIYQKTTTIVIVLIIVLVEHQVWIFNHQAKLLLDFVYSPTNNGGFEIDSKSPTQDLISRSSRNNPATRL